MVQGEPTLATLVARAVWPEDAPVLTAADAARPLYEWLAAFASPCRQLFHELLLVEIQRRTGGYGCALAAYALRPGVTAAELADVWNAALSAAGYVVGR